MSIQKDINTAIKNGLQHRSINNQTAIQNMQNKTKDVKDFRDLLKKV